MKSEKDLRRIMEETFVRGERDALKWVQGAPSFWKMDASDRMHVKRRITQLELFLAGKIEADKDGTIQRPVADFVKGDQDESSES